MTCYVNQNAAAEFLNVRFSDAEPVGELGRFFHAVVCNSHESIQSAGAIPIYDADVFDAARSLMLISDVRVRCTGHLAAISISFACCSVLRGPVRSISTSILSNMPSLVSHSSRSPSSSASALPPSAAKVRRGGRSAAHYAFSAMSPWSSA